ncbi:nitric oxide synthase oxygenase subunit [Pseudonocardia hierapolitana]|uniref:Nitric oxide synthase oxygenase subunit n=1 Tax=Pseudonocardia hierapolitana TaxID=1128676 RepID=A0A561SRU4_9PSEU|nr:nitric oxide synthase oxygenase subunit [Pseudonocardia hierapolitana]
MTSCIGLVTRKHLATTDRSRVGRSGAPDRLEIGGVTYPAAPFNGWYLGTEIGARNLVDADRYDLLPVIAERLGLDTSSERTLWRDRALVEMVRAVQDSFDLAGVTMADHHNESRRFLGTASPTSRHGESDVSTRRVHRLGTASPASRHGESSVPARRVRRSRGASPAFVQRRQPGAGRPGTWRVRPRNSATGSSPTRTVTS